VSKLWNWVDWDQCRKRGFTHIKLLLVHGLLGFGGKIMDDNLIVGSARQGTVKSEGSTDKIESKSDKWLPVSIAPPDTLVEVSVIDNTGLQHALMFPCCKSGNEWVDALSKHRMGIQPTHWRKWSPEGQRRNGTAH
jgi:hypothetical protein